MVYLKKLMEDKMKNIQVKNITLMEKVETTEAEGYYYKNKLKYSFFYIIPALLFFLFLVLTIIESQKTVNIKVSNSILIEKQNMDRYITFMSLMCAFIVFTILGFAIYRHKMKPYRELLTIAKLNDKIRHEEKIRNNERKRLETEQRNIYTTKEISDTIKQQKN